jgi:hypothetical protein
MDYKDHNVSKARPLPLPFAGKSGFPGDSPGMAFHVYRNRPGVANFKNYYEAQRNFPE